MGTRACVSASRAAIDVPKEGTKADGPERTCWFKFGGLNGDALTLEVNGAGIRVHKRKPLVEPQRSKKAEAR